MCDRFVYGEAGGILIFLREETAGTLDRLWTALATARTWGDLRGAVGDKLTGTLMGIAGYSQYPGDQVPFDRTPIVREFVESWTVDQLLEITARELPHLSFLAETPETMRLLTQYLAASEENEARIVLQLVGMGCCVDRNDDLIMQCLAVPRTADTS